MWTLSQLDDELEDWRGEREAHARAQYEITARFAHAAAGKHRLHVVTCEHYACCRECGATIAYRPSGLCRVCARAAHWESRLVVDTYEARTEKCGTEEHEVACGKCGTVEVIKRRCGARIACRHCASMFYAKQEKRLLKAMHEQERQARARWQHGMRQKGSKEIFSMLTLAVSHSGDIIEDRRMLSRAWNRWRTWYAEKYGVNLRYCWIVEVTDGKDAKGHVHFHVVALLPYRDYKVLRRAWRNATEGQGRRIHVTQRSVSPQNAAKYLAKYVTKGCKSLRTPSMAASWVKAQHGQRAISSSRAFWLTDEKCVHEKRLRAAQSMWVNEVSCSNSSKVAKENAAANAAASSVDVATRSRGSPVAAIART